MALRVRALTTEEGAEPKRLAGSHTAPPRLGQRAQRIWARAQGETAPLIASRLGRSALRVRAWIPRFKRDGLVGLADAPRCGRPRRPDETTRGTVLALARTKPRSLGLAVALWTLARLQQALHERHGLRVTPATIWKWLQAEGLVGQRPQRWCQAQAEPAFVEQRGAFSRPTRSRSRGAGSSASTSWAR
jgi:transposase